METRDVLLTAGMPANNLGYDYTLCAVDLARKDPSLLNKITTELYPKVAAKFETAPNKVERAIRHGIEVIYTRGRLTAVNEALGVEVFTGRDKPTNGEFIALLAKRG